MGFILSARRPSAGARTWGHCLPALADGTCGSEWNDGQRYRFQWGLLVRGLCHFCIQVHRVMALKGLHNCLFHAFTHWCWWNPGHYCVSYSCDLDLLKVSSATAMEFSQERQEQEPYYPKDGMWLGREKCKHVFVGGLHCWWPGKGRLRGAI